jgi:hypothetical protein
MDKNVSIVLVDKRPYRVIAQENWGLTDEQMKGKHVHHRIARSEGGTNDPSNLYVCSPSFHRYGWHDGYYFVEKAEKGARKAHQQKEVKGKSALAVHNGQKCYKEKLGIHSEEYLRSKERKEKQKKLKSLLSRPVRVVKAEGVGYLFASAKEASIFLRMPQGNISRVARKCYKICRGKWKGYYFEYIHKYPNGFTPVTAG